MRQEVMEIVRQQFRPEFLNRVDDIVIFHPLTKEDLDRIVEIQIRQLQKILSQKNLSISLTDRAKEFIGRIGYDPVYGARPLKRAIQQYLQNPLAMELLEGKIQEGNAVHADYDPAADKIVFTPRAAEGVSK
jgi:ATP-dependent Clp protease ATP-binding subunit ClpB